MSSTFYFITSKELNCPFKNNNNFSKTQKKIFLLSGKHNKYVSQIDSFLKTKINPIKILKPNRRKYNDIMEEGSAKSYKSLYYMTQSKPPKMSQITSTTNSLLSGINAECNCNSTNISSLLKFPLQTTQRNQPVIPKLHTTQKSNLISIRRKIFNMQQYLQPLTDKKEVQIKGTDNEKVKAFLKSEYQSVKKSIEDKINEGKSALTKEIDLNFASFQPQLLSHDKLSDKYTKFSKYIELTNIHNKPQHEPIPQHLMNTLYNINTIRNNYSYNPSQHQITKTYRTINSIFHNTNKHIRWRIAIYFSIKQLTNLNFQINQLSSLYDNKSLPFAHKHSQKCFQSVKSGDKETFQDLISYHKLILFDFDSSNQNLMHWIVKRNRYDYITFAVNKGACLNFRDFTGKTPLHYACSFGYIECVMVLLFQMANPFIEDNNSATCEQNLPNEKKYNLITKMIKRAKMLHLLYTESNSVNYYNIIKKGLYFLFVYEMIFEFNFEQYCLYESVDKYYIYFEDEQWNKINDYIELELEIYNKKQLLKLDR